MGTMASPDQKMWIQGKEEATSLRRRNDRKESYQ
jgi:hypothetical protein